MTEQAQNEILQRLDALQSEVIALREQLSYGEIKSNGVYTYEQAARLVRLSVWTVKRAVAANELCTNGGAEPRIIGSDLLFWVKNGCQTGMSLKAVSPKKKAA